jgi:hypothetical protein
MPAAGTVDVDRVLYPAGRAPSTGDRPPTATGSPIHWLPATACALHLAAVAAARAESGVADYQALQEWAFAVDGAPVPPGGLTVRVDDVARLELRDGSLRGMRPLADGTVTGLVFEGQGRFVLEVPDLVELRQLRRFAQDEHLDRLEESFTSLVLRWAGHDGLEGLAGLPTPSGPFSRHAKASVRHEHWLRSRLRDADARVIAALGRPGDSMLWADIETEERGWLTLTWDAALAEEIELERHHPGFGVTESWLSLDRAADRLPDGRPGPAHRPVLDLTAVEIDADLTKPSKEPLQGLAGVQPVDGVLTARLEARVLVDGLTALALELHPRAEVTAVRNAAGRPIPFLRDHVGARTSALRRKTWDEDLVVLLEEGLRAGSATIFEVDYVMRFDGYAPGRAWYPAAATGALALRDLHTGRMRLVVRRDYEARAMGARVEESEAETTRTALFAVDRPTRMLTFTLARKLHEEITEGSGLPRVATFGSLGGYMNADRIRDVGADVVKSLAYFQELFGSPLDGSIQASLIPSGHGQAFDGFLHVGDFSTTSDSVAAGELFRAHEVAHQWWGHRVGWASYRDQWLSEGFAEYSAMLFVQATLEHGERYFRQIIAAFTDELNGSLESAFSQFARPGRAHLNRRAAERIGPIGHGRRCAVGEAPGAYQSQVYVKGALVLHMLRELTGAMTGSDDAFLTILRTFISRFDGGFATTADFEAVVTEIVPADWSWFFDQWIQRAEIPSYRWSWEVRRGSGETPFVLDLHVERRGVSDDFRMPLPVRVTLGDGRAATVLALMDDEVKEFSFPLPGRPRKVELAPDGSVLADIDER